MFSEALSLRQLSGAEELCGAEELSGAEAPAQSPHLNFITTLICAIM